MKVNNKSNLDSEVLYYMEAFEPVTDEELEDNFLFVYISRKQIHLWKRYGFTIECQQNTRPRGRVPWPMISNKKWREDIVEVMAICNICEVAAPYQMAKSRLYDKGKGRSLCQVATQFFQLM